MMMLSDTFISNYGNGPQNVKTGDGSQYNNNDRGQQFINSNFYGIDPKDLKVDEAEKLQREKEDCLHSLSYKNIDARKEGISFAHPKTCDWFFETMQFRQWCARDELPNHNGVFWIKGNPGTGKSTLMKHILRHCEEQAFKSHIVAAHFFNARGDNFEQTPLGMLRSLLYQLLEKEPSIYERFILMFREKWRKYREEWEWGEPELKNFLLLEIQRCQPRPLLLLIDALDECSEPHVRDVVEFLENLSVRAIDAKVTLNICLSSRHYPHISMKKYLGLVVEARSEHDEDIIAYTRDKLTKRDEEIEKEVLKKASGVFMWVVLVIKILNKAYDEGQIEAMRQKIQDVPSDLEDVFETLLSKDNSDKHETIFMLQCVLFARRLLKPEELYFAMIVGTNAENKEVWTRSKMTQDDIRRRITNSSRGLIEVRKGEEETVQFIHESVNDFLTRNKRLQRLDPALEANPIGTSHEHLKSCCMSYIMMEIFQSPKDQTQVKALGSSYPFLEYASTYVLAHAEEAGRKGIGQARFLQRLEEEHDTLERVRLYHNSFEDLAGLGCTRGVSLLYMLTTHGYNRLTKILLEKGIDVNTQEGGLCGAALQTATVRGEKETVAMLLKGGANINARGGVFGTALHAAALRDEGEIIAMLLKEGADVNTPGGIYGTALQAAAGRGSEDTISMLLKGGADVNVQAGIYGTALQAAARKFNEDIVSLLLNEGADANAQGGIYGTALQAAALGEEEGVIALLLKGGADVNAQGGTYGTALQAAAERGNEEIVSMLLKGGADVNAQGGPFGNALQAAIVQGKKEIIAMLLKEGADVNAQGGIYGTALQAATITGMEEIKAMLLKEGANTNTQRTVLSTVLQAANIPKSEKDIITILLREGVNANAQGIFHIALHRTIHDEEIITTLLKERLDANNQWIFDTALHVAAGENMEDLTARLLEKGANMNAQSQFISSALMVAIDQGSSEVGAMLFEHAAGTNTQLYNVEMETKVQIPWIYIYICLICLVFGMVSMVSSYFIRQYL